MKTTSVKTIGVLTSGGDAPGLNAAIRALCLSGKEKYGMKFVGVRNGYRGLIDGDCFKMDDMDFSGMTFKKFKLDALVCLGGNGTNSTAARLSEAGFNVIGLPKTIDNDIAETEETFGFHTAIDVATAGIEAIRTTARSHGRAMVVEIMGHKVGWLGLHAGIAGNADVILLPEIPYDIKKIGKFLKEKRDKGQKYFIIACSEGALDLEEAKLSKKEYKAARAGMSQSIGFRVAKEIEAETGFETRTSVLGYLQRGGSPDAPDMLLAPKLGSAAADFLAEKRFGNLIGIRDGRVAGIPLSSIIDRIKPIPLDDDMLAAGRSLGICFGD